MPDQPYNNGSDHAKGYPQRRLEAARYITEFVNHNGYPPSVRDLGERLGLGTSAVHSILARMESEGLIQRAPGVARGIRLTGAVMKESENHL